MQTYKIWHYTINPVIWRWRKTSCCPHFVTLTLIITWSFLSLNFVLSNYTTHGVMQDVPTTNKPHYVLDLLCYINYHLYKHTNPTAIFCYIFWSVHGNCNDKRFFISFFITIWPRDYQIFIIKWPHKMIGLYHRWHKSNLLFFEYHSHHERTLMTTLTVEVAMP